MRGRTSIGHSRRTPRHVGWGGDARLRGRRRATGFGFSRPLLSVSIGAPSVAIKTVASCWLLVASWKKDSRSARIRVYRRLKSSWCSWCLGGSSLFSRPVNRPPLPERLPLLPQRLADGDTRRSDGAMPHSDGDARHCAGDMPRCAGDTPLSDGATRRLTGDGRHSPPFASH
jgi:hypothetical protein